MSLSTKMLSSSASSAQSLIDIPLQELPGEVEEGEFFDVIVVNVKSPSKFFVQLKSQHLELTALMDILVFGPHDGGGDEGGASRLFPARSAKSGDVRGGTLAP